MEFDLVADKTILDDVDTGGLGKIEITHPQGAFSPTPASRVAIRAIGANHQLLAGNGLDWGCGTGCLAIAAAKIGAVRRVVGLDIEPVNVETARQNAHLNGVADKTAFFWADSYAPFAENEQQTLAAWRGRTNFVLSNPPASEGDDGFEFRRVVLRGASEYLVVGGVVFLNISYQYGRPRIDRLTQQVPSFRYEGLIATTDWLLFDMQRPDLLVCVETYAAEELGGGEGYCFRHPQDPTREIGAVQALACFQETGLSPLSQWQTHLFRFE